MKLYYVKIDKDWDDLDSNDYVIFDLPTKKLKYKVYGYANGPWILTGISCYNDEIFKELDINGNSFAKSILGYIASSYFPEVNSLHDLKKVIKALDDKCIEKFGLPKEESIESKPKFKVGDKVRILPRKTEGSYRFGYVEDMLNYVGTVTTIERFSIASESSKRSIKDDGYRYELKGNTWSWASSMFELAEDSDFKEGKEVYLSELKEGDYIKITSNADTYIDIFKEYYNDKIYRHAAYFYSTNEVWNDNGYVVVNKESKITYATSEEKKLLDDALLKKGYIWDDVSKKLLLVGSANLTAIKQDTTGTVDIPYDACGVIAVNKYSMLHDSNMYMAQDKSKEELNLFPTKKHYQLNFNY